MRRIAEVIAAGLVLAACGSGAQAKPVTAHWLASQLGCGTSSDSLHFAAYDVRQDLSMTGSSGMCLGGEVWTFPSQKAETDWLHLAAAQANTQFGGYNSLVVGKGWVVYPGSSASLPQVARILHGRQVTF